MLKLAILVILAMPSAADGIAAYNSKHSHCTQRNFDAYHENRIRKINWSIGNSYDKAQQKNNHKKQTNHNPLFWNLMPVQVVIFPSRWSSFFHLFLQFYSFFDFSQNFRWKIITLSLNCNQTTVLLLWFILFRPLICYIFSIVFWSTIPANIIFAALWLICSQIYIKIANQIRLNKNYIVTK